MNEKCVAKYRNKFERVKDAQNITVKRKIIIKSIKSERKHKKIRKISEMKNKDKK